MGIACYLTGDRGGCCASTLRSSCVMKILALSALTFSLLFWTSGLAQHTPQSLADTELPSLLTIYKDLHSHPELSTKEDRSAGIVAKELRAAGCDVTENFGKYDNRSEERRVGKERRSR